jgi:predicted MPP superfamily phosphohydrolase
VIYATFVEPRRLTLERVEVALPGLPREMDGLRILQVSDLESRGQGTREAQLETLAREADADILVITGDLVAKTLAGEARARCVENVARLLGQIPARRGRWFVEGHGEAVSTTVRREILDALQARGVRFLRDDLDTVPMGGSLLALVGIGLHPAGREGRFFQRPDGSFVETGRGRTDSYLNYLPGGAVRIQDYEFTGQFRFTREEAGVGVTFYNRLPLREDRFHRLRRGEFGGALKLAPHGTTFTSGKTSTGLLPRPGPWYAFRVRVETESGATWVRGRVWEASGEEPPAWSVDARDASPERIPGGTVGLWTWGPGRKEFRRLGVVGLDGTLLMADGRAAGGGPGAWEPPEAPDYLLRVAARLPAGAYPVALAHSPDVFPYTAALGWPLLLAGHTQGGQIRLPWIGALATDTVLGRRYASGLFERGGSRLYISRGIGTTRVPFRFLAPPELALVILRRAEALPAGRPAPPGA